MGEDIIDTGFQPTLNLGGENQNGNQNGNANKPDEDVLNLRKSLKIVIKVKVLMQTLLRGG